MHRTQDAPMDVDTLPELSAPTNRTLSDHITRELRTAILTGQLRPGQRLVEQEIARSMHTSRGPVRWLQPDTVEVVERAIARGERRLLLVPVSFVSDHIETLYEIDREYGKLCYELGFSKVARSPSLNDSPAFISCLAELVRTHVTGG
jgi:protoheme ferro-lyase